MRTPNPLFHEFLDKSISFPPIHWETVPPGVNPWEVWDGYDEGIEGWVPVWYHLDDSKTGRSYGEFERAHLFSQDLERIVRAMHRWPLWGSPTQKKHTVAYALLQLFCEVKGFSEKV